MVKLINFFCEIDFYKYWERRKGRRGEEEGEEEVELGGDLFFNKGSNNNGFYI